VTLVAAELEEPVEVDVDAFVALGYGPENPLLEVRDGRAIVTPAAHATPWYRVLADMLCRKEQQQDARRFTFTVADAANLLDMSESAVRQAIQRGTLQARKVGSEYRIDHAGINAYRTRTPSPPGPKPKSKPEGAEFDATVLARIGSAKGMSFRIKGAKVAGPKAGNVRTGTLLPGWNRALVLGSRTGRDARLWELEPAPGMNTELVFQDFYLRGAFKVLAMVIDEKKARDAFAGFKDDEEEKP